VAQDGRPSRRRRTPTSARRSGLPSEQLPARSYASSTKRSRNTPRSCLGS